MHPFAEQILAYTASDADRRAAGLILEVKGDFCHKVRKILKRYGREDDYFEISLDCPYRYWDVSIFKNFVFGERFKAQFRTEALNAFNTPYFYPPTVNISSGSFGHINSQANFARQLQLAIRLTF